MNIDDPPPPLRDEIVREQPHIAGEGDDLDIRGSQRFGESSLISGLADAFWR